MQIGISTKVFATSLMISLLAACSSTSTVSDAASTTDSVQIAAINSVQEDSNAAEQIASEAAAAQAVVAQAVVAQEAAVQAAALAAQQRENQLNALRYTIYFDFDQSMIKAEFRKVLNNHVVYLANNPGIRLLLEGHADERGTREYNMALGERRGNAVSRYLVVQGVSADSIEVISFGEERPVSERFWAENRRVEIRYLND